MTEPVLLDTCAMIWVGNGMKLAPPAWEAMEEAGRNGMAFISPISAWEVGLLSRSRAGKPPVLQFRPDPKSWLQALLQGKLLQIAPLTIDAALAASSLPGELHRDPGNRLLIATARHMGAILLTRDRLILDYSRSGHVKALAC